MATVLVVDDSRIIRNGLKNVLEKLGHVVVGEAENGFDGVKLYKELYPDVVTMDITMPATSGIKNGMDAVKHIIEFDEFANIIMITAHGEQQKVMQSIKNGAKGYILKPITRDKVRESVQRVGFTSDS